MDTEAPSLLDEIDAFTAERDMSPITFGRLAMRDPHFVRDLRQGRRLFRETEDKVRAFMAEYQPERVAA